MHVPGGCKMISLDMYGGKRVLLGFLLLASFCWRPVRTIDHLSLNVTTSELKVGDRLISTPNPYFELVIFQSDYSGITGDLSYYLSIRYASPIGQVVTWVAKRDTPLTNSSYLKFQNHGLGLFDPQYNHQQGKIWSTDKENSFATSAQLLDTGNLVLKNESGAIVWSSFNDTDPTDTLLPGQRMHRRHQSKEQSLTSWPRSGVATDTYKFGWDAKGVLSLSWTCPKVYLNWKGGPYIPAPDVYAAHTIQNVDNVYFDNILGNLYIGSDPPTAILSGGRDPVSDTTLKRITMSEDGGLRILQYTINKTANQLQASNQGWKAVANWVVSDRPDSRSQCTTYGTCGAYAQCISLIDSLEPVECQCPGQVNLTTNQWFTPVDNDPKKGCLLKTNQVADCLDKNGSTVEMLVLPGVDMPWGGDYLTLTGDASSNCKEACQSDCHCQGAVFSEDERKCWLGTGALYNLGYPTVALHGTNRISYLRIQIAAELKVPKKDSKWVKILVPAGGILGVLLIALVVFSLWRNETVRQRVRACGLCCRRPTYEIKFPPDEMQVRNGPGDGAQI